MIKELNKLVTARAALERAAEDLGDPAKLGHFRSAISSLSELMSGVSPRIEKDLAKKLLLTYRSRVLFEAKMILAQVESYRPEHLEHWNKVMEVFVDPGVAGDPEFNECKKNLFVRHQAIADLKSLNVDVAKKTLHATTPQNEYPQKSSNVRTLLHAKVLSAIGQYLEILRVREFELEKQEDFYLVRSEFLREGHERILRNHLSDQGDPASTHLTMGKGWLRYEPLGTARQREVEKKDNHGFKETDKLAQLLSIVGDYLDSKKSPAFRIRWASDSVWIDYDTPTGIVERSEFPIKKLQQLAFYSEKLGKRLKNVVLPGRN